MSDEAIRITFVRHGQSEANLAKRWQGQSDSPLSALGRAQAERLGARLARRVFTHVVSSDLGRAVDTARATGFPFQTDATLREFDVGSWEGLSAEEVAARYGDELERLRQGEDVPLGGGESYALFAARVDGALDALRARLAPGDHALVVCHGGVIGTALAGALGLRQSRRWRSARPANASITELSFSAQGTLLHVFNDTLHLASLGGWPDHGALKGSVALLCDVPEQHSFGAFAARYLADEGADLAARLAELQRLHPRERVALAADRASVHAWAEATLFGAQMQSARLAPPAAATLCHAGLDGENLLLLDYGVSA